MSQTDLAKRLRVTSAAVSSWEGGSKRPGDRIIPDLAKHLQMPPAELLTLINEDEMSLSSPK